MRPHPTISSKALPSGPSATFRCSSYFSRNGHDAVLPSPSEVLAKSAAQDPRFRNRQDRPPVRFEELGLLVKFGKEPRVTIAEGQCLWTLRRVLPQVPVPEVYGWVQDEDYVFLFMELVQGVTLKERWACLTQEERIGLCENLRTMLGKLRHLRQEPGNTFLGDISRGPFGDVVFTNGNLPRAGPFSSVKEFHDWLSAMTKIGMEIHWPGIDTNDIPDPYRQHLPDNSTVVFTHADLHPGNILVSLESPCRIMAIIDWQLSGWYPDYWEFCKAEYTAEPRSEWVTAYIPRFLEEPDCVEAFEYYAKSYGY
ncbi:Uncharacterized protein TPAR_02060 [Tolypocladium paradoxum]|uniref:Aminoglycoside phosphotransferase domain-containing protein n=1 Tax=Tolypocladium paradoxum TaxID=94208 RepID=A0A2S4L5Q0_9HYPO|nr:Uncharacterized protein TPAR_02060 [Tolypocladium paradoxum]